MSDQISLLDGDRFAPGADLLDVDSCQRKWMVEPGEVFTFDGRTAGHVLICGDARSRAVADLAVRLVGRTRSLRTTLVTRAYRRRKSSAAIAAVCGHTKEMAFQRYRQALPGDAWDVAEDHAARPVRTSGRAA
jgi:hypothetical protein